MSLLHARLISPEVSRLRSCSFCLCYCLFFSLDPPITLRLLYRLVTKIHRVDKRTRVIMASLSHYMNPSQDYLSMVVCKDEVDEAILLELSAASSDGWSTTDIAERLLPDYKLNRFQVLRRIKRMNKHLEAEMGRPVAESRERRWVMTRYCTV